MDLRTYGRVTVRAVEAFRDAAVAERWLKSPARFLDGRSPLQALKTPEGAIKVERQLSWYAGRPIRSSDQRRP